MLYIAHQFLILEAPGLHRVQLLCLLEFWFFGDVRCGVPL